MKTAEERIAEALAYLDKCLGPYGTDTHNFPNHTPDPRHIRAILQAAPKRCRIGSDELVWVTYEDTGVCRVPDDGEPHTWKGTVRLGANEQCGHNILRVVSCEPPVEIEVNDGA